jgi:hypothetical protein
MYADVSFIVDVKKHHRCVPKDNEFRCLANGQSIKVGVALSGTTASHKGSFPQAMDVTESHHIVLIKFSHLNRTTSTFVLKFNPRSNIQYLYNI